ncbi:MAG: sigma-70 family RNA polymerase sigma factor [Myxococcota bacterium]
MRDEEICTAFGAREADAAKVAADTRLCVASGNAAWPDLALPDATFVAWLAERAAAPDRVTELDSAALFLTCAVASGVEGAVEAFQAAHGPDIDVALRRVTLTSEARDDARQLVLTKLLAPGSEKLRDYGGRGSLSHWVRAVAVRQAISLTRRRGPMEKVVGEPSTEDPDVAPDPELAFLKAHYRDHFRRAFAATVAELPPPDRTLLRLRFVDGLTLDQVARVRDVHRATAARHLARLRGVLLEGVRAELSAHAGLSGDTELGSVLRLVESNLELSLPRILGD